MVDKKAFRRIKTNRIKPFTQALKSEVSRTIPNALSGAFWNFMRFIGLTWCELEFTGNKYALRMIHFGNICSIS